LLGDASAAAAIEGTVAAVLFLTADYADITDVALAKSA